ncbi:TPA: hypothetical protein ACPZUA_003919 [Yersinia enterocolitica]|uniref:hypothetical protein n=1 Tax=Yersinia TaxID=629 RepID=UPI00119F17EF|nr:MULTISPECIES: hypothetical protein [Yersinia]EKN5117602.1 hypothetical protein [Yersinia enterocolitica]UYJ82695.1 hypothetical protein N4219_09540 [Yersinia enterocolitica]HDL7942562.1 hypothetical protein [Yersinia enterocolitica]HDL8331488.1 hypothetical protein [Yersinia enterocolitica]HDM8455717.1 hypothetical protein [Yersinia enterocolitica]
MGILFTNTDTNPSVDSGKSKAVKIGDFTISNYADGIIWIESDSAGDAGSFDFKKFEAAIKSFYEANL